VEIAGSVRAALMAVPSRLRQTMPHLTAADVVALDREIRDALIGLSSDAPPAP
jgi:phage terminase Nu1 subunit (DNA packaging protein)